MQLFFFFWWGQNSCLSNISLFSSRLSPSQLLPLWDKDQLGVLMASEKWRSSSFRQKGNLLAHEMTRLYSGPENVIWVGFLSISLVCLLSYCLWLQHHRIARGCLELHQHSLRFQTEQKKESSTFLQITSKFYVSSDWVTCDWVLIN